MKLQNKKAIVEQLGPLAIGIGSFAIIIVVIMTILGKIQNTASVVVENSSAYNATTTATNALSTVVDFLPIVAIALIGFLLIFLFTRR